MLDRIKLLLNISNDEKDELITTLITMCKDEARAYCNFKEYKTELDNIIVYMVVESYNRLGSEGTTSQQASGISASYESFYSDKIIRMLNKHRRVRTV